MSVSGDSATLFTGLTPVESSDSGEAFNPCPHPAPSPQLSSLYGHVLFPQPFLLAALSAAQQGTNSLLIATYLGNE